MLLKRAPTLFIIVLLLVACDQPQPQPAASSGATAKSTTVASATSSAVPTASSSVSVTPTASALASAEPPAPPPTVSPIRGLLSPQGVTYVYPRDWMRKEDKKKYQKAQVINVERLENMDHPSNVPIKDIVIQHSTVRIDVDGDEETINKMMQNILDVHQKRGWGHVNFHAAVGPDGRVFQGRIPRYRADGTVGQAVSTDADGKPIGLGGPDRYGYNWHKYAIMVLGDLRDPEQFTNAAKEALTILVADREVHFNRMYGKSIMARHEAVVDTLCFGQKRCKERKGSELERYKRVQVWRHSVFPNDAWIAWQEYRAKRGGG